MNLASLPAEQRDELELLVRELHAREHCRFKRLFPDDGPLSRAHYPQQMQFFAAGRQYKERLFMAANRVGKSEAGAYELVCHATGRYPDWWTGRRFAAPIEAWACGTTGETTRDIVQEKLLGPVTDPDAGMVPRHLVVKTTLRPGRPNAIESIHVAHTSGGVSVIGLKSYEQGRPSFEGTAKHVVWCDEEPPQDCYTEMLFRTATTGGIVYTTFTPLQGRSAVVNGFLEADETAATVKTVIQAGWDDVPHLPADEKAALLATTPPHQLAARTKGEPLLGAGAVYPIAEADILCDTFAVPDEWPRAYAMDVGWNRTAVVWGARDPGGNVLYLYSTHYQGQGEPPTHADAIRARGAWMSGVIDPAGAGSSQIDGRSLIDLYTKLGLKLSPAENSVETGITQVWTLLVSGRLKIMRHLTDWLREFRNYHRDDKGRGTIVKREDHLMDATRYLVVSGVALMRVAPKAEPKDRSALARSWAWG
mgnify:CR=1 FL=1